MHTVKTRWIPRSYEYTQCDELAEYLQEMARKGWRFQRFRLGLFFEACKPCEEVYDVQVFLKNKDGDLAPTEDTLEFAEYCRAAGWELVDSRARFAVFQKVREDALPISTAEEKMDAVFRAQRRIDLRNLLATGILAFLFFGQIFLLDLRLTSTAINLFDPLFLSTALLFTVLFCDSAFDLFSLLLWRHRTKAALAERSGDRRDIIECKKSQLSKTVRIGFRILEGALLILILVFALRNIFCSPVPITLERVWSIIPGLLIYLIIWGANLYDRWGHPSRQNTQRRTILVLLVLGIGIWFLSMYHEAHGPGREEEEAAAVQEFVPPLVITDLVDLPDRTVAENYTTLSRSNLLGSCMNYSVDCGHDGPVLAYEVSRTASPAIANLIWKEMTRSYGRTVAAYDPEKDPEDDRLVSDISVQWGASRAICVESGGFYTCYVMEYINIVNIYLNILI